MRPNGDGVSSSIDIRRYAMTQASARLGRFAFEIHRAATKGDHESIHDLRTSIRRLSQCLRVFAQFFPARDVRKIRKALRRIMKQAGEIRNRDITLGLLEKAGVAAGSALPTELAAARKEGHDQIVAMLEQLGRRNFSLKWRARLNLTQ